MSEPVTAPRAQLASTTVSAIDQPLGTPEGRPEADLLQGIAGWLSARLRYASMMRELERLDDRMLADIGMERPRTSLTEIAWRLSRPSQWQ
jgi:uncharacterized protein YjiS (DUF1127 family)